MWVYVLVCACVRACVCNKKGYTYGVIMKYAFLYNVNV